jgi:DNA-binding NtrC family response regulator
VERDWLSWTLGGGRIRAEHFGPLVARRPDSVVLAFDHEPRLDEIEKDYLRRMLGQYGGNRAKAALVLGISERNIYRLIKQYELGD